MVGPGAQVRRGLAGRMLDESLARVHIMPVPTPRPVPSPALFPEFVAQHSIAFDPNDDAGLAAKFPGIALPASLARAVPKRRVEYCAGRLCAREALRACAPELADAPIASGAHGEPLWPAGVVGTITHTHEFASAAVASTRHARALGLDAERLTHLSADVLDYIALPAEVPAAALAAGMQPDAVASIVFSAKEALFKCLYPEVGRYFDFRDALIESLDAALGTFSARLLVELTPQLTQGMRFAGRFSLAEGRVYTAIVLQA
jgi:enterobactin synthetase component D